MRVLWVQRSAALLGGAERVVHDAAGLLARGIPDPGGKEPDGVDQHLLFDPTAPLDPAFLTPFRTAFPWADLPRQIETLDPDVIYLHQVGPAEVEAVARSRRPSVRFLHDHAPFCLRRHKYTAIGHRTCTRPLGIHCLPCLGFLERRDGLWPVGFRSLSEARAELGAHRGLTALAVGSRYMKDHVVMHGFPPASVEVLPLFAPAPEAPPESPPDPNLLVFLGALTRGKGLDLLLRAMTLLPREVRLRVLGTGPQEAWLREVAGHLGVAPRVEWSGALPRAAIAGHLREALCLVVPSREPETFGLVGLEAFRHGTPVIASRAGGVGEWLQEGRTGLAFPPGEWRALAQVLGELRQDPARARAMGLAGREVLSQRFLPDHHARALWDLLRRVAGTGRAPG
ncbi:MAG TPA: glycosyltransferase family 4 protein [Myxococcota bacterium]|nr:glycosyltransferase family 4 protein [Myxococcota bacterium]HQK51131.1 glycosyltransferase family 4 protein [Myxococcota bacterium]